LVFVVRFCNPDGAASFLTILLCCKTLQHLWPHLAQPFVGLQEAVDDVERKASKAKDKGRHAGKQVGKSVTRVRGSRAALHQSF
jgi:hypothetical protein